MPSYSRASTVLLAIFLLASPAVSDSPQFRGPDRDGIYPASGLLQSWPAGGPKKLWSATGLGDGYASVSVVGGRIYTTGASGGRGSVVALDTRGKHLWKKDYGAAFHGNGYPGTRTTPTFDDGLLYVMSSLGKAVALAADSGEIRWQANLLAAFRGPLLNWGIAESPLVLGDKVIYTPGGAGATMVALDKKTGEKIWASSGPRDPSAYCSPRLFDNGKHRQIVTMTREHVIAVDPDSGELLWQQPTYTGRWGISAVSPLFAGNEIFVSAGYGERGKMLQLAADGKSVELKWRDRNLDVHHGGVVLVDGHIYGAASKGTWIALDAATGKVAGAIPRAGKGSVVYADGRLYGYTEAGEVLLVDPDPARFRVISGFGISEGYGQHWAHPVITDGVLYIRHGDVLMAFDVAAGG